MSEQIRVVLAQLNLTVGDIKCNLHKHLTAAETARTELGADVIVFPELGLTGYPPEDLLLREEFLKATEDALQSLIQQCHGIYCLVSHPHQTEDGLYNACSLIYNGALITRYAKSRLPNYGVFDENRYFIPGNKPCVTLIKGVPVGLLICEDLWYEKPAQQAAAEGARLIISLNASPFEVDKHDSRIKTLAKRARQNGIPIIYANHVGGQDELIYDGGSLVMDAEGKVCQFAGYFNEILMPVDLQCSPTKVTILQNDHIDLPSKESTIYQALVVSVRDYVEKNQFAGVLIGVSGGIDSALVLTIAVDAIGSDRVKAIIMPSRHTAPMSIEDAVGIANNLGVAHEIISIEPIFQAACDALAPSFQNAPCDKTEENLQARSRALILMALSNKFGSLVLTTGNRSELAVGYCTLYGDMAGGFSVLKDIPKTTVYALARFRNTMQHAIPERTIERAPTAELAPDQKDEDSLPPYPILDKILHHYLNVGKSIDHIVELGFDRTVVEKVIRLVQNNEYKRRQSAVGPRINHKSFGRDWRYPITNQFKFDAKKQ